MSSCRATNANGKERWLPTVRRDLHLLGYRTRALEGLTRAADQYIKIVDGKAEAESVHRAWRSVWVFSQPADTQAVYLVRAIVRNKLNDQGRWRDSYGWKSIAVLKRAVASGVHVDTLREATFSLGDRFTFDEWHDLIASLEPEIG